MLDATFVKQLKIIVIFIPFLILCQSDLKLRYKKIISQNIIVNMLYLYKYDLQ